MTGSQVNRIGYASDLITLEHVAESMEKVNKADIIITLNQNNLEERAGKMRWHIAKAREREITNPVVDVKSIKREQRFGDWEYA
jgi:hypothetical protein